MNDMHGIEHRRTTAFSNSDMEATGVLINYIDRKLFGYIVVQSGARMML